MHLISSSAQILLTNNAVFIDITLAAPRPGSCQGNIETFLICLGFHALKHSLGDGVDLPHPSSIHVGGGDGGLVGGRASSLVPRSPATKIEV